MSGASNHGVSERVLSGLLDTAWAYVEFQHGHRLNFSTASTAV